MSYTTEGQQPTHEPPTHKTTTNKAHSSQLTAHSSMNHNLTPREIQVAQLLSQGLSNKQIGHHLGLSHHTIKNYVSTIYSKLGAQSRIQAALTLVFAGQLPSDNPQSHTTYPERTHPPEPRDGS